MAKKISGAQQLTAQTKKVVTLQERLKKLRRLLDTKQTAISKIQTDIANLVKEIRSLGGGVS